MLNQNVNKQAGKEQSPDQIEFSPLPVCKEAKKSSTSPSERSAEHNKDHNSVQGAHDDIALAANNEEFVIQAC